MKIALLQSDICWNDPARSLSRVRQLAEEAAGEGARLLLLPEMFSCGFSLLDGQRAAEAEEQSVRFLQGFAREHSCYIAGSMPAFRSGSKKPFNLLQVYGPDGLCGEYAKIHLISLLREDQFYSAGDALLTLTLDGLRVTFFICFDLRFPELFASAADSTDCFVVSANWPDTRQAHWEALLAARAIENQAYVAGVNRVGAGGQLKFAGGSMIVDPSGAVAAKAGEQEAVVAAEVAPQRVRDSRAEFGFIADRRSDLYAALRGRR